METFRISSFRYLFFIFLVAIIVNDTFGDDSFSSSGRESDRKTVLGCPRSANCMKKSNLSSPEECSRTCKVGAKPKTCYYHFTVEYYATLTAACDSCISNATSRLIDDCQCVTADGYETSGIIVANRMYPGPLISICKDDHVVIDVENRVPGGGITIHWHGILQAGSQYYDGVPYVTQCPIQEGTIFRYRWKAQNTGTHFWHAHTGVHKSNGLEGPIIVREPKAVALNNRIWDDDLNEHIIFIADWFHDGAENHFPGTRIINPGQTPDNFLINGKGQWTDPDTGNTTTTPLAVFTVKANRRYRFRLINSGSLSCSAQLTIQEHNLTIFETDGEPIVPINVTSITSSSAERYDFVLKTDKTPGKYWIQVRGLGGCASLNLQQLAILQYESATNVSTIAQPTYLSGLDVGVVLNPLNDHCNSNTSDAVCIHQLNSIEPLPSRILKKEPDIRLYLPFGFHAYDPTDSFKPETYQKFLVAGGNALAAKLGNISNIAAPVALISQEKELPRSRYCSLSNYESRCKKSGVCQCTHVEKIPLNAVVEIVLVDEAQIPGLSHPFHLHGHAFYIFGEGSGSDYNISSINLNKTKELDKLGYLPRNFKRPPAKDTYAVPNNGFSIIRFFADNPGYWLFHCHILFHLLVGMSTVFHVGEIKDLPPIPEGFPRCGDFTPPI